MKTEISRIIPVVILIMLASSNAEAQSIMNKLKANKETTHFAAALENTNLDERLDQKGPFTLFAPSNRTFDELSDGQQSDSNLLLNHIFTGMATERSLKAMSDITCLSGRTITIQKRNGNKLSVDSFVILTSNIRADNGVIHIIDGVIR